MISIRKKVNIPLKNCIKSIEFLTFNNLPDKKEHIALCFGNWRQIEIPLVRIHSECLTGDLFYSLLCDCGEQLNETIHLLDKNGGILLYLRQEGRGIGLYNKLDAYHLQKEQGYDTYKANAHLGFPEENRDFKIAADILKQINVKNIKLITNNPEKIKQLKNNEIEIKETIQTQTYVNPLNVKYLTAKKNITKHRLNLD
ncbi:GTP cyclohydrolase II RibA [Silvanigrella paludirubra]|uniref:GTP cyclohydrolase II n=1 Tax=Silvanigrella paludirubra TaxID=2499159 RepID=A0A6N6VQ41_9BACT|nr:GTP cyclohydrolase II [Silvanigrella paludirubra]KAB8037674.1 GTP cyclohydrolase II RibA [Silvanigrella paludirubra]